ncbi:MAG: DUF2809 domain-containing protein [Bizionia sp.]|nr:DUF2809 domain-containing protein [Bizionia sp.]
MKLHFNRQFFILFILLFLTEVAIAFFLKSGFIRHTFGDYLVVIMLFYGVKSVFKIAAIPLSLGVLIFAFSIECLQLTPLLSALNLEDSTLAKLILGCNFSYQDLIAYTLGIVTVLIIDFKFFKK